MKRVSWVVCVLLVLTTLAGLSTSAAATPSFSDDASISNICAVDMLTDLGLISGYPDGSFRPRASISRQEVLQIVARLLVDEPQPASLSGFSDVADDSPYAASIYYCYERGIVAGSNGAFRPDEAITARALARILLGTLGYDTARYVGDGWDANVDEDALAVGIYDGFDKFYDAPVTRDDACLLIFNAMQSYLVEGYGENGEPVYHLDELMNPQSLLEYRYGVVKYSELLIANEYADMTVFDGRLEDGFSQLEHHRALEVPTDLEMLGRQIVIYARDGVVLGVPTYSPYEEYHTFADFDDFAEILVWLGLEVADSTQFYYNFNESTRSSLMRAGDNVEITIVDHTGDGLLDVVLMIEYLEATVVSTDDGVLTALIGGGEEPVAVTADAAAIALLSPDDVITVSLIGGRCLLMSE